MIILGLKNASLVYNKQLKFFNKYILKNKPLSKLETSINLKSTPKSSSSSLSIGFVLQETVAERVKIMPKKQKLESKP